jgi:hypothetical protein
MSNACRSSEKDAIEKAGLFERISEPSPSIRVGGEPPFGEIIHDTGTGLCGMFGLD